jgi:ribosomal protein S18 acetylase RimI-like enzyme
VTPAFRPGCAADALCIGALGTQVFLSTYATAGIRTALAREALDNFAPAKVEALLEDPSTAFIVAENAGHLIGFAQVSHGARHVLVPHAGTAEVDRLYVHERFTGRGIGKALLRHAETLASSGGADAVWLTAWVGNVRANGFYPRQGYTDVGATGYAFGNERVENRVYLKALVRSAA